MSITVFSLALFIMTEKKKKERDKSKNYFKNRNILKKLTKNKFLKNMENYLKEAGYPLGINIDTYILLMLIFLVFFIYVTIDMGIFNAVVIAIIALVPMHAFIYQAFKKRKNQIQIALCDIQDIVYFQSTIGTPIDVILANAAKIAKDPLKIPLEEASAYYRLTRDLDKSLDILKSCSNIMEIQAFALVLKQRQETGFSEQNHKAQAIMMKRNKRLKKRLDRELKRNKLLLASVLLFVCYVFMVIIPILKEVFVSIQQIMD